MAYRAGTRIVDVAMQDQIGAVGEIMAFEQAKALWFKRVMDIHVEFGSRSTRCAATSALLRPTSSVR